MSNEELIAENSTINMARILPQNKRRFYQKIWKKLHIERKKYESINLCNNYYFMFSFRWITYIYFR